MHGLASDLIFLRFYLQCKARIGLRDVRLVFYSFVYRAIWFLGSHAGGAAVRSYEAMSYAGGCPPLSMSSPFLPVTRSRI